LESIVISIFEVILPQLTHKCPTHKYSITLPQTNHRVKVHDEQKIKKQILVNESNPIKTSNPQLRLLIRMPSNARNRNSGTHELNKSQHELKTGRRATWRERKAKDWDETERKRERRKEGDKW